MKWSHCGFDLHFSVVNDVEQLFICLLVICVSCLERCVFKSFVFKLGCLFIIEFINLIMFTLIYFWPETLFSLVFFLPFSSVLFTDDSFSLVSRRVERRALKPFCILLATTSTGKIQNCGIP